jgi:hypothetical protein
MKKVLMAIAIVSMVGCVLPGAAWAQNKPATPAAQKAAADPLTGDWEGTVDMPDGSMPFSMKLKLDGDKVTGEVGSQQGAVAITSGSFAENKLTISFTYVDGAAVTFTGTLTDGQFVGSLNYGGGQMVTNWAAKKKAAK